MDHHQPEGLSAEELAAEDGVALPDKEVVSILDLNADLDLAIDAAAPIDLGVAANANVAAPIDASASANLLSTGSTSQALGDQGVMITQGISADAIAHSTQDSTIDQGAAPAADAAPADAPVAASGDMGQTYPTGAADQTLDTGGVVDGAGGAVGGVTDGAGGVVDGVGGAVDGTAGDVGSTVGDLSDGNLLNVNVNLDADANVAAPIDGAVAANANVAAPIDAAVSANIGSVDSDSIAVAQQDAIINQNIDGSAEATTDQTSDIQQP